MLLEVLLLDHGYEAYMGYSCSFLAVGKCLRMDLLWILLMKIMRHHGVLGRMFGVPLLEIAGWGRPSSRGGAGCRRPYPLSTSQSHIQIYILTLRLPPQHSSFLKCQDQPDSTTTCTSFPLSDSAQYLPRFHLQRVNPPTSLQAHTGSLLMTHACSLIKLLLIGDSGESGYF